jgi:hypothetical protein
MDYLRAQTSEESALIFRKAIRMSFMLFMQISPAPLWEFIKPLTAEIPGLQPMTMGWVPCLPRTAGGLEGSRADPTDPDIAYAIGFDNYKTTDGGNSWNYSAGSMHVDHHAAFIHPLDNSLVLDANDGGLYISTDGAGSWTHIDNLPISQFYTCEIDNSNTLRLYGGLQDNNVVRTLTGATNDWESIIGGDGFYTLVDPLDNDYLYAESQYGALLRSTNGGFTFSGATTGIPSSARVNWNTPVVFNPQNSKSLYYGANKVYKTLNRAVNWTVISPELTNGAGGGNITFGTITTLSVSPIDTNIIYAGTDDGNVWMTTNNGSNWTNVSATLPDRWVTRVTCDPDEVSRAYVTFSGYRFHDAMAHVYMTVNNGQTWESVSGNLPDVPCNDILIDPALDSTLYLATDAGVFVTSDLGSSWTVLGDELPITPITDLTFHQPTRILLAATYGRSMYSLDLSNFTATTEVQTLTLTEPIVYPNPATDILNIDFSLAESGRISIDLCDEKGQSVWKTQHWCSKGKNQIKLSVNPGGNREQLNGIYFMKINSDQHAWVKKILLM